MFTIHLDLTPLKICLWSTHGRLRSLLRFRTLRTRQLFCLICQKKKHSKNFQEIQTQESGWSLNVANSGPWQGFSVVAVQASSFSAERVASLGLKKGPYLQDCHPNVPGVQRQKVQESHTHAHMSWQALVLLELPVNRSLALYRMCQIISGQSNLFILQIKIET